MTGSEPMRVAIGGHEPGNRARKNGGPGPPFSILERTRSLYAFALRRRIAARPKRPAPRSGSVEGSGTCQTSHTELALAVEVTWNRLAITCSSGGATVQAARGCEC